MIDERHGGFRLVTFSLPRRKSSTGPRPDFSTARLGAQDLRKPLPKTCNSIEVGKNERPEWIGCPNIVYLRMVAT